MRIDGLYATRYVTLRHTRKRGSGRGGGTGQVPKYPSTQIPKEIRTPKLESQKPERASRIGSLQINRQSSPARFSDLGISVFLGCLGVWVLGVSSPLPPLRAASLRAPVGGGGGTHGFAELEVHGFQRPVSGHSSQIRDGLIGAA